MYNLRQNSHCKHVNKTKEAKNTDRQITVNTGITSSRTETLLGFKMHENMDFSEDIMDSKDSLRKTLNTRIGALKKIRKVSSFKAKLNIENGIVVSEILYLLPLYAGCPYYLLFAIQTKQTEAMRQVTGKRWVIPGREFVATVVLL